MGSNQPHLSAASRHEKAMVAMFNRGNHYA